MTTNADRYPDFSHEDELINHRLTWLLQSQALLFAGYGLVVTSDKLPPEPANQLARSFIYIGIASGLVIFGGIAGAALAMFHIWNDTNSDNEGKRLPKKEHKPFGVRPWTTAIGVIAAMAFPWIFIFGWYFVASTAPVQHAAPAVGAVKPVVEHDKGEPNAEPELPITGN